jgi:hypothetical protein
MLIRRNLTALLFLAIYLVMVAVFLFLESFNSESQLNLLSIMLPCILLGIILDFIISRNSVLTKGQKLFTQLLPTGVFVIYLIILIFQLSGHSYPEVYNYLYYLFITAPFAIVSYRKEGHKSRMIFSLLGTAVVFAFYLYLTTLTTELDKSSGLLIFLVSYFMMFYSASTLRRLPYLSTILGVLVTAFLWYIYRNPITPESKIYGWDYDYLLIFEYTMMIIFIVCIVIRLLATKVNDSEELTLEKIKHKL